jgi:hypothetical protein
VNPDPELTPDAGTVPIEFRPEQWQMVVAEIERRAPQASLCLEAELGGGTHDWYKDINL